MTTHPHDTSLDGPRETMHRSDRPGPNSNTNVGRGERVVSAALGTVLLARGLGRRSVGGAVTALAGGALLSRGVRGHSRLYRLLDVNTADSHERLQPGVKTDVPIVERSVTVGRPADELGSFWRDAEQLSRIAGRFADVSTAVDGAGDEDGEDGEDDRLDQNGEADQSDQYVWTGQGPFGRTTTWKTRLVDDEPGDHLRWETVDGAAIPHSGTVQFRPAPGDRGTEVTLRVQYEPPGGSLGNAVMQRFGVAPHVLVGTVLRRFKSLAETGEIPTLEGNPSARGRGDLL